MASSPVRVDHDVTPNRRGARSREAVLDAAERLIAEHGYEAATVAALVKEAGIPRARSTTTSARRRGCCWRSRSAAPSGSSTSYRSPTGALGSQREHLRALLDAVTSTLERHPDFLRILVVLAAQPPHAGAGEVHRVVNRVRELALVRLREQMHVAFGLDPEGPEADHLARFWLATLDGAFVAHQSQPAIALRDMLEHLPAAVIAVRRELGRVRARPGSPG